MKLQQLAAVKPAFVAVIVCLAALSSACGKNPVSSSGTTTGSGSTSGGSSGLPVSTAADLVFCVDEANRYRAMRSRPALVRSASVEQFAADSARIDHEANRPHQHFNTTSTGFAAENEVLRWPYNLSPTVRGIVAQAIQTFFGEGPGGGHYENIIGPWTQIGCGIFIDANGITVVQDFR